MKRDVCILLSTCDRYRSVAEWTASRIQRDWKNHPPLRYAGLGDARDWMSVNLAGVNAAREEGFRWIYLVLDDHPPLGRCRHDVLNTQLPSLAGELDAVNIGLLGWGQRRGKEGERLGKSGGFLLRNEPGYRWKFSLHPALWSADALAELLSVRIGQFAPADRTPWNFERHRDAVDGPVRPWLLENTYRVNGRPTAHGNLCFDALWREPLLAAFDIWRFGLRVLGGQGRRDTFDRTKLWLYQYYRGPYPLLWSGAVRQGKPSRDFANFLRFTGRRQLQREWRKVQEAFCRSC